MTKSAVSCGFGNIYWRNPELRNLSFVQCGSKIWWNQPSIFISCALILGFLNLSKIFYAGLQKTNYDKYSHMILREKCPYSELFSVSLRIQSGCGKIRTKITPNMDTLYGNDSITFHPNFLFFVLIWENMFKLKNWLEQHVKFDKNWCFTTTQWQNQD